MRFLRRFLNRFRQGKLDAEMAEEMRHHVELQTELNRKAGMDPDEARYAAQRQFGNVASVQQQAREGRGWVWLEQVLQDFRHALRALGRNRGFTFVAVATLGLGLGLNTALFSVFNAVALRPLPLKSPEQLVDISGLNDIGWRIGGFSYPDYTDVRAAQHGLAGVTAWMDWSVAMDADDVRAPAFVESRTGGGGVAHLPVQLVSDNFFSVLGGDILLGRGFLPQENAHPGANPVIVLQHQFWTEQFGGDPGVIGRTIKLGGIAFTVVGVAAPEFIGKRPAPPIGWLPAMMLDALAAKNANWLADRHNTRFQVTGRLRPDVPREQARAELEVITRQLARLYPDDHGKMHVRFDESATFMALPLNWKTLLQLSPVWLGFVLVLLIACANVANLLLARASIRQQEIGVRLALGASRGRILRHLLAESVFIALAGGIAGLLITTWTLQAIRPPIIALVPPVNSHVRDWLFLSLAPDYRVFAFTLMLALIAAIAAGLFPALQASRAEVISALKIGGSMFTRPSRLRHALVVVQVAVCLTLLTASGLLVRQVLRFGTIDTGLHTDHVVTADLTVLPASFLTLNGAARRDVAESAHSPAARRQAMELARTLPGIKGIAQVYREPFSGRMRLTPIQLDGRETGDATPVAQFNLVSAEYFSVVGLPLLHGRVFSAQEVEAHAPVVVINEATAQHLWPGQDPLGKNVRVSSVAFDGGWVDPRQAREGQRGTFSSFEVIGVTRDTRSGWVWEPDETMLYLPLPPEPEHLVATAISRRTLVQFADRREVALPLAWSAAETRGLQLALNVRQSLDEARDLQLLPFKGVALVGACLGGLALLMAVAGLYGVMAFVVSQRTREIGVRVALGASAQSIMRLFVRQGMRLVAIGLALGAITALAAAVLVAKIVVGVQPFEFAPLVCVALLLSSAALLACWLPARRATKVDPMVALRAE